MSELRSKPATNPTAKRKIRERTIKIRLSQSEYDQLQERKIGKELASWIRTVALGEKVRKPVPTADPELLRQLAKMGGNLNQIAFLANAQARRGDFDALAVLLQLSTIKEQLQAILERSSDDN